MNSESILKIALPGFPVGFTVLGAWLYWGDNPLALLPPPIAFWGLVMLYYLFTHLYMPKRRYPLVLIIAVTTLWCIASITSHNLARFISSKEYAGMLSVLTNRDFWYAYGCACVGIGVGLFHFRRYEPMIVAAIQRDNQSIETKED